MGINVNMDYSTLFSSLSGSSSTDNLYSLTSSISDYASIRNGSYGKLVKAYYEKIDSESEDDSSSDTSSTSSSSSSTKTDSAKAYTNIVSDADDLQESAAKLNSSGSSSVFGKEYIKDSETGNMNYDYNTSKITSAVKSFVSDYNSLIKSASKVTDSTVSTRASYMQKVTSNYEDALSQIGITLNDNGTLSVDSDKLSSSNMEAVKSVFGGSSGYAYQVSSAASLIESGATSAASSAGSSYTANGSYNFGSATSSIFDSIV
ncbi:MAG: flagellar filament capping protein FliD [Butyrivibrio sp.]|nr:flagellar filament capping protein FliD [Butyrivibrio sp.]